MNTFICSSAILSFRVEQISLEEVTECVICMQRIKDKVLTPCNHEFCRECIYQWVVKKHNCPLCRQQIAPNVEIKSARTKFREVFVPRRLVEDIHQATSSILGDLEEAITKVAEDESNGQTIDLRMAMTRPILGGMLRYTQFIQSYVSDNI